MRAPLRWQTDTMSGQASATIPTQASALRKGGYAMLKGFPCKIVDMSTSKTGKHGHAKIKMVGIDIFTGDKKEDLSPSTHTMEVPVVTKTELQVRHGCGAWGEGLVAWPFLCATLTLVSTLVLLQLLDITDDGFLSLMLESGETREDIRLPDDDVGKEIRAKFDKCVPAMAGGARQGCRLLRPKLPPPRLFSYPPPPFPPAATRSFPSLCRLPAARRLLLAPSPSRPKSSCMRHTHGSGGEPGRPARDFPSALPRIEQRAKGRAACSERLLLLLSRRLEHRRSSVFGAPLPLHAWPCAGQREGRG